MSIFCSIGFEGQRLIHLLFGAYLPGVLMVPFAFCLTLPTTKFANYFLAKAFPDRHVSDALSEDDYIGRTAKVTLGISYDLAGKANFYDQAGTRHSFAVKSHREGDEYQSGDEVLIVEKRDGFMRVGSPPEALQGEVS